MHCRASTSRTLGAAVSGADIGRLSYLVRAQKAPPPWLRSSLAHGGLFGAYDLIDAKSSFATDGWHSRMQDGGLLSAFKAFHNGLKQALTSAGSAVGTCVDGQAGVDHVQAL